MREVIRNLILGFFIFISLFAIFYYFQKGIARRALLAEISGFFQKEENFEKEILVLKEKINSLEENLQNVLTQIQTLKGRENDSQKMSEIIKRTERKVENLTKKSESLVKEVLKNPKICQNFETKEKLESVIFNEICWMGNEDSPAEEWIELKNLSQKEIDLAGWQILNKNQKIKIIFEEGTKILPGEFLVLSRGDDFIGAIKNSNEALFLFDENCILQDKVLADKNWPAGDSKTKRTMERKSDFSWQTSENSGGTPGKENSRGLRLIVEKDTKEGKREKEKIEPKITLNFPSKIFAGKEFEVLLSASDLKFDQYDVKISILKISDESEQKRTISEISLTGEEWQDSHKYLTKVFRGDSFSGKFKIRVDPEFSGLAEILAKIRKSANKSLVAEFKDKIEVQKTERIIQQITLISPPLQTSPTSQIKETQPSQTTETQPPQTGGQGEQISQPLASNLLSNEFFERWSSGTSGVPPDEWGWTGTASRINQSSDALVGKFSVELTLTTKDPKSFNQYRKIMTGPDTSYYVEIWVKGVGMIDFGFKNPHANSWRTSEEIVINTTEWKQLTFNSTTTGAGDNGGIRIRVWYDTERGVPSGSKLLIGAAWLSTTRPPENWLQK